MKIFVNSRR